MDIKNYRIKNLIMWDLNNPREDNQPEQGYIIMELMSLTTDFNRIVPIPLSNEWLLRFGFKKIKHKHHDQWFYEKNDIGVKILSNGVILWDVFNEQTGETEICGELKHVHELQNLFFDEYKKELEYV